MKTVSHRLSYLVHHVQVNALEYWADGRRFGGDEQLMEVGQKFWVWQEQFGSIG
jgi:hypothetical protein